MPHAPPPPWPSSRWSIQCTLALLRDSTSASLYSQTKSRLNQKLCGGLAILTVLVPSIGRRMPPLPPKGAPHAVSTTAPRQNRRQVGDKVSTILTLSVPHPSSARQPFLAAVLLTLTQRGNMEPTQTPKPEKDESGPIPLHDRIEPGREAIRRMNVAWPRPSPRLSPSLLKAKPRSPARSRGLS